MNENHIRAMNISLCGDTPFNEKILDSYKWNNLHQKIWQTLARNIQNIWTVVSTLLSLISWVYPDLHHWRSNQQPQTAEQKLCHYVTGP